MGLETGYEDLRLGIQPFWFWNGGMETEASFVGTDGAVELYAVAAVDAHAVFIVDPADAEFDLALRFGQALQDGVPLIMRILLNDRFERGEHFGDGLLKFGFVGIASDDLLQLIADI